MNPLLENLPRFSQRDPRWASLTMGASGKTLGDWGCTLTCGAALSHAFARGVTPDVLLQRMNAANGFDAEGSLSWLALMKCVGIDFGYRWDTDANVAPNHSQVIEAAACDHVEWLASTVGYPSVCWVDTDHDGKANHWVLAVGGGQCIDPWDGQAKPIRSFGRLYGYAVPNGDAVYGTKVTAMVAKANDIAHGRNVALNAGEIMQVVNRP